MLTEQNQKQGHAANNDLVWHQHPTNGHGSKARTPSEHPPKMAPLVLTHSQKSISSKSCAPCRFPQIPRVCGIPSRLLSKFLQPGRHNVRNQPLLVVAHGFIRVSHLQEMTDARACCIGCDSNFTRTRELLDNEQLLIARLDVPPCKTLQVSPPNS